MQPVTSTPNPYSALEELSQPTRHPPPDSGRVRAPASLHLGTLLADLGTRVGPDPEVMLRAQHCSRRLLFYILWIMISPRLYRHTVFDNVLLMLWLRHTEIWGRSFWWSLCTPVFTRMPGESYSRRLGSLLTSCDVFRVVINSLCWLILPQAS